MGKFLLLKLFLLAALCLRVLWNPPWVVSPMSVYWGWLYRKVFKFRAKHEQNRTSRGRVARGITDHKRTAPSNITKIITMMIKLGHAVLNSNFIILPEIIFLYLDHVLVWVICYEKNLRTFFIFFLPSPPFFIKYTCMLNYQEIILDNERGQSILVAFIIHYYFMSDIRKNSRF